MTEVSTEKLNVSVLSGGQNYILMIQNICGISVTDDVLLLIANVISVGNVFVNLFVYPKTFLLVIKYFLLALDSLHIWH